MEFRTFGKPIVIGEDGHAAPLGGAKQRLVLATLLRRRGDFVGVDDLIDVVWPSRPPRTAPNTLRSYVSNLRRVIGHRLVIEQGGYRLVLDQDDGYDVDEFEDLVRRGHDVLASSPDLARSLLQRAISIGAERWWADLGPVESLYGFRAHLANQFRSVQVDLARAELALGDVAHTVGRVRLLLSNHPFDEELWVLLIGALHCGEGQVAALGAYQDAVAAFAELGLEPSATLRAAEQRVYAGAVERQRPKLTSTSGPSTSFVGHTQELEVLFQSWNLAQSMGDAHMVLLVGEDGIGKTRLAREAASRLPGIPVIHEARCIERTKRTFQPFDQLFPVWQPSALDARFDLLGDTNPEKRLALGWDHARRVLASWRETCSHEPRVVLLDELHWMHDEAFQVLMSMATASDDPLLIIGACRPSLSARALEAFSFIESFGRFHQIDVQGLNEDEVRRFLAARELDAPDKMDQLLSATDGSPARLEATFLAKRPA